MAKEYHIVCGEAAKAGLVESNLIDFSLPNIDSITLMDNLNEGKLYDLKTLDGIEDRVKWFEDFYQKTDNYCYRENHSREIRAKLNKINSEDSIYVWLGNDGKELIWKSAILNYLQDINVSFYVIDWSDITFFNIGNEKISSWSVNVISLNNIKIAYKNFRLLAENEKIELCDLWRKLLKSNVDLRVLNAENQIEETDITYHDQILISNCQRDFQPSYKVVGEVIGFLHNGFNSCGIGDQFLSERLKQLCYEGKLHMHNQEHGQENGNRFEVALMN